MQSSTDLPPPEDLGTPSLADWMNQNMPAWLRQEYVLLSTWQWLGLLAVIFIGLVVHKVALVALFNLLRRMLPAEMPAERLKVVKSRLRPFGLLLMSGVWWIGLLVLGLRSDVFPILASAVKVFGMIAGVWGTFRVVDILAEVLGQRAMRTESKLDDLLIPLVRKTLKVFIFLFGVLFIADNLGSNVTSLLAGLGLGGLAFALAAQDTVKNLFGTLTILLDRTYNVGDWVTIAGVEGTVEHVGFRSTRIRTFYNSLITVPNSQLITATVDNFGLRRYRRWKTMLSLTYDTPPERIEAFCAGVRELIQKHPYTRKDYYHVYLNAFSASSLQVLVYMFHSCPDWGTELRERERLILDILRLARKLEVEFAFPTQTLHLQRAGSEESTASDDHASVEKNQALGQNAARSIVRATLGEPASRPAPVRFDAPGQEVRGGGDAGGE